MNGVVSRFDELYEWITTADYYEEDVYDYPEGKRHSQLWELAINDGDAN